MDTVQQIKDRLSIVDVVSQYVKLERSGQSLRARCPFHAERTPSFFVSPERGTYHCFGCSAGGDIFSFVEQIEGLDFKGTLKILAEKAGVPLVYLSAQAGERREKQDSNDRLFELLEAATIFYTSRLDDVAREYLLKRGIGAETIRTFRVGLAGSNWSEASDHLRSKGFSEREIIEGGLAKNPSTQLRAGGTYGLTDKFRNRIMFPIADSAGRVVGFSGRIFGEHASPEAPKYLNSPETPLFHKSRILYGFDHAKQAIRRHNCAVLVEGQLDLLASHQAGWGNTVAVSGTAFTPEHAALIRRMTDNLVIALDADEAGIKAAGRAARAAIGGGLNVKVAELPTGLDPADLILKEGADAWRAAIRNAKDIITFLLDVLEKHAPRPDTFRRNVEAIVLPFLSDVQSPIAKDQYVREVAGRLGVSETAVEGSLARMPKVPASASGPVTARAAAKAGDEPKVSPAENFGRAQQAFSLLLWQESLKKPELDLAAYEKELEQTIGAEALRILRGLPESEQEALRFSAESVHGKSRGLQREANALLMALARDRLSSELADVSAKLKQAEARGDEAAAEELMRRSKLLTTEIAHLHE